MDVHLSFGEAAQQKLEASRAIVLYENGTNALATVHSIGRADTAAPVLMAGALLTREMLREIVNELSGVADAQRRLLPANVLCAERDFMAWHVPARRLPIFFNTHDAAFNKEMTGATALHPPLLFAARPRVLSVWALAQDARPQPDTPVYRAPYFNLYEAGNMCAGTVSLPADPLVEDLEVWERAFYDTNFTHANVSANSKLTSHADGHNGLWRVLAQPALPCEAFPTQWLLRLKDLTVGKVIQG